MEGEIQDYWFEFEVKNQIITDTSAEQCYIRFIYRKKPISHS